MKDRLRRQIGDALQSCFDNDVLHSGVIPEVQIEVPGNPEHGDFSSNLAMTMARAEKKARADENARCFGRSKSEKQHEKIERDIAVRHLDGHKADT